jgi:uncharacterized membrane protein YgcG
MKQLFLILTLFASIKALALEVPSLTGPVVDQAKVLSTAPQLEATIRSFYQNGKGPQINILTIPTLNGDNLEEYAHKVFTTWQLGDKAKDDGVLFLIVINDHKMRIEVGQGLEGTLTDLHSKRILGSLKSYFRSGDYNGGITSGLNQIIKRISTPDAVQQPATPQSTASDSSPELEMFGTFLMGLLVLGVVFLISNRLFAGTIRQLQRDIETKTRYLKQLTAQEQSGLESITVYQKKIQGAEQKYQQSLSDIIKSITKKYQALVTQAQEQTKTISSLQSQEYQCPATKMDTLKSQKSSLNHSLQVSQNKITEYQNLIQREK